MILYTALEAAQSILRRLGERLYAAQVVHTLAALDDTASQRRGEGDAALGMEEAPEASDC